MPHDRLRRQIAWEAARLIHLRHESQYRLARSRAARRLGAASRAPVDLPSQREIRGCLRQLERHAPSPAELQHLCKQRLATVRILRELRFGPAYLVGNCLQTPSGRRGISLHLFCDHAPEVIEQLRACNLKPTTSELSWSSAGRTWQLTRVAIAGEVPASLTIFPLVLAGRQFRHRTSGQRLERLGLAELERLVADEYPSLLDQSPAVGQELNASSHRLQFGDRFRLYRSLLEPLERIRQNFRVPPNGDLLYHSLHVFELVRDQQPYDEELLSAALLHDVGKAIDPRNPIPATIESLEGVLTPRMRWLLEHQAEAQALESGTLGHRSRKRLEASEDYHDLVLLGRCERLGRKPGADVPNLDDALDYLRDLSQACEG